VKHDARKQSPMAVLHRSGFTTTTRTPIGVAVASSAPVITFIRCMHDEKEGNAMNHFRQKPDCTWKQRVIDGQVYVWDDTPEWEFGQVWIPVCARCGGGPLMKKDTADGLGLLCDDCAAFPAIT
jgi:hypothetical protein